jgi:hypothetical protein
LRVEPLRLDRRRQGNGNGGAGRKKEEAGPRHVPNRSLYIELARINATELTANTFDYDAQMDAALAPAFSAALLIVFWRDRESERDTVSLAAPSLAPGEQDAIKAALPAAWYYVNPEPFLPRQIPISYKYPDMAENSFQARPFVPVVDRALPFRRVPR